MILKHFSEKRVRSVTSHPTSQVPGMKPIGFWVSVGDEWKEWCEGEHFGIDRLVFEHNVTLKPKARIKYIKSAKELDDFQEKYMADHEINHHQPSSGGYMVHYIDWAKVQRRYDGIIIAPYLWERRLHINSMWYYGWDCASGCIWNKRAIDKIEVADGKEIQGEVQPKADLAT